MFSPFSVNALRIRTLLGHPFTLFCNDLVRAEAGRIRLPQRLIDDTVRETVPDGGVDLLIGAPGAVDRPTTRSEWLPEGMSVWQYKSGNCPSAKALAKDEFQKQKVREAISRGEAYCFLTADSINAVKAGEIKEVLEEIYRAHGQEPKVRVYGATKLAEWAKQHLGVAARHLGVPVTGWLPFDQWEQAHDARNEFFPDKARTDLSEGIRESVRRGRSTIRILGRPGFGKTRAVMESVREEGLRQRVLYLPDAANFNADFVWHLRQDVPYAAAILVIDECTSPEYERIRKLLGGLPGGVTVVLIGPQEDQEQADFALDELPREEMAKIVADFAPGLNEAQRDTIAARCGGSPKLVVFVAGEISRGEIAISGWGEIERAQNVAGFLNQLFPKRESSSPEAKVMRAISLMTRLGWWDEVEHEGQMVTGVFGLDWADAKLAAQDLRRRGVVSKRGRYLYATPDILANSLTRETIVDILGTQRLNELFASLPDHGRHSLAERLRQLGDDPAARQSVARILDDPDFLGRPGAPGDASQFYLLRLLAPSLPNTALGVLKRFLNYASREELLVLDAGVRREMVRMLEELAWWREHFVAAAKLLLRLAWAETENYANNATGIWAQLFQVMLGGTEAPFRERFELLRGVLADPDPGLRKLGLVGLSSSLQTRQVSRFGGPPDDTGRLPPEEWRPATYGEWGDILKDCSVELAKALDDPDPSVRREAISVLADRGSDLIGAGLVEDWTSLVGRLVSEPFELRKRILDVVENELEYDERLSEEERASLERLAIDIGGTSFSDRLRRVVGSWEYLSYDPREEGKPDPVSQLAQHALRHPGELEGELEWLFGGEAPAAFPFGKELGRADTNGTLLPWLLDRWSGQPQDDRVLTGYLMGGVDRRGEEWLEEKLDAWARDPARVLLVAITTWRALPTPRAADRLRRLLKEGDVPPEFLNNLVYGFWARDLEPEQVKGVVEATYGRSTGPAVRARLHFLEQYVRERPEGLPLMRHAAEEVLREVPRHRLQTTDGHSWQSLAELVYEGRPMDLARLAVYAVAGAEGGLHSLHDEAKELLQAAVSSAEPEGRGEIFLKVVGPALEQQPAILWNLDDIFDPHLFGLFDVDTVLGWLEEDIDERLLAVARNLPVRGQPLAEPARSVLVRHGGREEVRQILGSNFLTGSWSGSESAYMERKLAQLRNWTEDANPNVRAWAHELTEYFEGRLQRTRLLEEEGP